jgi:hypothetical protein
MPTTISNPASFSSVRSAFSAEGYGSSTSFFAYRQGGGIVPATSAFNVIGAGSAGDPLRLSQFSGFTVPSPVVINISNQSLVNITYEPFPTYIRYRLNSNGKAYQVNNDIGNSTVTTYLEDWVVPNSSASDYEVFATVTNGANLQGDLNTWVPLSFTRDWILESNIVEESFTAEFTIQIRKIGTSTVLDTANISLTATYLGN